ncbi:DJ-1 family glyoxalase III [uncultured Bacteroides sp.]|uniref:DJ-1 family glyoxalase III n=1 Tax=uncultured Bacteroides sp. TaxID=162156 RepID=UPI002AAAFE98|nr:DJ-1 family glyoxalase III [uncultured Bacteroides sp.]
MGTVYVFLAEGFEEIEAISVIDILRRAGIYTKTISITGNKIVLGAHAIPVVSENIFEEENFAKAEMLILPGGMPGASGLDAHKGLRELILDFAKANKPLAAICAAPLVYGNLGLLKGKLATCYPGFEKFLEGALLTRENAVVRDGLLITAEGPAAAPAFALEIVAFFAGKEKANEIAKGMIVRN